MFTIKHERADGVRSVSSCESYELNTKDKSILMRLPKGEIRTIKLREKETLFIENMNGKTCDLIRH